MTIESMVVVAQLRPQWTGVAALAADPGRQLPAEDVVAEPTVLAMLDLPDLGVARHDVPVVHLAACTTSGPWRPVPIEIAVGGDIRSSRSAFGEAIIGSATTVLADGQAALLDMSGSIEVELADADYWLESRDDDALANGANLAVVGSELSSSASRRRSASGGSACRSCYAGVAGRSGRWRHMLPASPSCC